MPRDSAATESTEETADPDPAGDAVPTDAGDEDIADSIDATDAEDCSEQRFEGFDITGRIEIPTTPELNWTAEPSFWEVRYGEGTLAANSEPCTAGDADCENAYRAAVSQAEYLGRCSTFDEWSDAPTYRVIVGTDDGFHGVARSDLEELFGPIDAPWEAVLLATGLCLGELDGLVTHPEGFEVYTKTRYASVCEPVERVQVRYLLRANGALETLEARTVYVCPCDCCI